MVFQDLIATYNQLCMEFATYNQLCMEFATYNQLCMELYYTEYCVYI